MIRSLKKTASFILCLCFIFPLLTSVFSSAEIKPSRKVTWEDVFAGAASPEEMFDPIPEKDVPAAVGYADALKRGHIERLYKEETGLNTAVFRNADGSKTLYSFDYPIKYITETGSVRDISLSVSDSGTDGVSYQSDAKAPVFTQFSSVLSDGIRLRGNSAEIKLIPLPEQTENDRLNGPARIKKLDDKTVSYRYGVNTTLEYSLTYSGFKEDIVVSNYTGQTEYSFELQTGGLTPVEIDGEWYLTDSENEIKASIGNIIIFTADERNNGTGTITVEEQEPRETYLLTIHVDPDYLSDPKTVYPIRIDPTIEINASSAAGSIEDVTINQNTGSSGSSTSLYIGCRNTYGITRILMRFPNLDLSAIPSAENITSASVSLRDLMCQADEMDVFCYVFNGNSWTESTAEWSNVNPNSYTLFLSSNTISYNNGTAQTTAHWYPFDVTNAVKGWKIGSYTQGKGILFKASGTVEAAGPHSSKTFASFNRASYKPYLIINYTTGSSSGLADGTYYLNNQQYGQFLKYSGSVVSSQSGLLANLGSSIRWDLQRYGNNYVIHPVGNSSVFLAVPESTSANTVTTYTSTGSTLPSRCLWTLSAASGGGGILKNAYNSKYLYCNGSSVHTSSDLGSSGTTTYRSRVWRIASISYYGNTSSHTKRELEGGFSVNDLIVNIGQNKTPVVNQNPTNAIWASASDFSYSYYSGTSVIVSFNTVTGVAAGVKSGIATYKATHKVTNRTYYFKVYVDRYTYELVHSFGFGEDAAILIRDLYNRVDNIFYNETSNERAWKCARVLSEFCYDNLFYGVNRWNDVAGSVTENNNREDYFINTLGYSSLQYSTLNDSLSSQHGGAFANNVIDFCHLQYSLAARLAYLLGKDSFLSNWFTWFFTNNISHYTNEEISYFGGWLGDAVLIFGDATTTTFKNDDYMSDLDAENLYRIISQGSSSVQAFSDYYASLASGSNRATIFKNHISYDYVCNMVFSGLLNVSFDDEENDWNEINNRYHDTYNFLKSLDDSLSEMANY